MSSLTASKHPEFLLFVAGESSVKLIPVNLILLNPHPKFWAFQQRKKKPRTVKSLTGVYDVQLKSTFLPPLTTNSVYYLETRFFLRCSNGSRVFSTPLHFLLELRSRCLVILIQRRRRYSFFLSFVVFSAWVDGGRLHHPPTHSPPFDLFTRLL